jgi:formamidopyrimidine-DNA glycosylase
MPELPEVQTTVSGLRKKVLLRAFIDVWTDWKYSFDKEKIKNKKIIKIYRRAKNIIFDLSGGQSLLVHMKMTGHLLVGKWKIENRKWKPSDPKGPLNDPYNRFLHLIFFLDDGQMLALSDARKFAKAELWKTNELKKELEKLGPEPLEKNFTLEKFKKCFENKKGKIKQLLMDPKIIAGIGNIYSSEILWQAKVHPEKLVQKLSQKELKEIYLAIKKVLQIAVKLGGESFSDYRKPDGSKGDFDTERKAYKREKEKCKRCKNGIIKRIKQGQRSTFFCPICQKL